MNKSLTVLALIILIFNISCKKNPTSPTNTAPTASFTVDPTSGTIDTIFTFDASGSRDNEDATSVLQVRWDWENDGVWDTNYSTTKTATHQYNAPSTKTVTLEVKDTNELIDAISNIITVNVNYFGTVTDIDGNMYNTMQIGNQLWMAENLKVTHYRNGNAIPNITDNNEWNFRTTGAQCSYNNDENNVITYGRLYNSSAIKDSSGLAPEGWHIPTDEEWKQLEMYLGISQSEVDKHGFRGTDEGSKLKSTSGWYDEGNGTNESGFSALPGGGRNIYGFYNWEIGYTAIFWSSTYYGGSLAWYRQLHSGMDDIYRNSTNHFDGYSVRCIRD